jgi:putative copper export protein
MMFALEAATSAVAYCSLALLLGCLTIGGFLLPQGKPDEFPRRLLAFSLTLLSMFIAASMASLVFQGAKLNGGRFPSFDILDRYVRMTQSGKIWAFRELYALLLGIVIFCCGRTGKKLAGLRAGTYMALPLIASRSFTSHAVAVPESTGLALSADALHLLATAMWAGGLPVLFWVLYCGTRKLHMPPTWTAMTVSRFSLVALVSVTVLAITGLYQSWIQVQQLALLFETTYGQVLTLKLLLFFCMIILGAVNFLSTKPKLLHSVNTQKLPNRLQKKLFHRIGGEAVVGLGIFCVTAFLTLLPPGIHSLHQSSTAGGGLKAYPERLNILTWLGYLLSPAPTLQPAEGAKVTILSPKPGEIFHSDQIPLHYDFVQGKRGHHVHAYIDGQLMGMFSDQTGGTLNGVQAGKHVLELRVTTEDHLTELDATDKVNFVVE